MGDPIREETIRVGISSCLLGQEVRFDGGHKRDAYVMGTLDGFFTWVPVCPEMEVGMGVPRETVHLTGDAGNPRMVGARSGTDWTERMQAYARERLAALVAMGLHGYILKARSPSCGMDRVKVKHPGGGSSVPGRGLFAAELMRAMPELPVEDEGRLNDALLRENFIVRVFSHYRWSMLVAARPRARDLVEFHARHKFLILAHSPRHLVELGRIVARVGRTASRELLNEYERTFHDALRCKATPKKHVNVLQHIAGFYRKTLSEEDRRELHESIADYSAGLLPLIVPLTLIRHHARIQAEPYIQSQVYLNPHPRELRLLNHV